MWNDMLHRSDGGCGRTPKQRSPADARGASVGNLMMHTRNPIARSSQIVPSLTVLFEWNLGVVLGIEGLLLPDLMSIELCSIR